MRPIGMLLVVCLASGSNGQAEEKLAPKLQKGLELLWTGTYSEEQVRNGPRGKQEFDFSVRMLVLDKQKDGYPLAVMTSYRLQMDAKNASVESPAIVHLAMVHLTPEGHVSQLSTVDPLKQQKPERRPMASIPLAAMNLLEIGVFVHLPNGTIEVDKDWEVPEFDRPKRVWHVEDTESPQGARCYRVVMHQQNADWNSPRRTGTGWRRTDTIWLSAVNGYASKVDRLIEQIGPEALEVTHRYRLMYELKQVLPFRGEALQDRMDEIKNGLHFQSQLEPLLPKTAQTAPGIETLIKRISIYEQTEAVKETIPYREALISLRRKAEAAKRGEVIFSNPP